MADDDRLAKAARAKALLKKRQQKKTESSDNVTDVHHRPNSPVNAGIALPSPSTEVGEPNEFGVFINKSPVVASEQHIVNVPAATDIDVSSLVDSQRQAISLLVSERTTQAENLKQLDILQSELQTVSESLSLEKQKCERFEGQIVELSGQLRDHEERWRKSSDENIALVAKLSQKEKEIKGIRDSADDLRQLLSEREKSLEDARLLAQNNEIAETLSVSLRNAQSRADELEFQLSKVRQTYNQLKNEHEDLKTASMQEKITIQEILEKQDGLQRQLLSVEELLVSEKSSREILSSEKNMLQEQLRSRQSTLSEAQGRILQLESDLDSSVRDVMYIKNQLRAVTKRAEDAENAQKDLQSEGRNLMHSLDEMRPKLVELTNYKLDMSEEIRRLRDELQTRNILISNLRAEISELQQLLDESSEKYQDSESTREKDNEVFEKTLDELRNSLEETQVQLRDITTSFSAHRTEQTFKEELMQKQERRIADFMTIEHKFIEELKTLREELEEERSARTEAKELLVDNQSELESLRSELSQKENELARLRDPSSNSSSQAYSATLDEEVMNSLKVQAELEISSARTHIRSLETSLFDEQEKTHAMQNQITLLQDEILRLRINARQMQPRNEDDDSLSGKALSSERQVNRAPVRLSTMTLGSANLSPKTRHQRQVSLSMLKARLHSEAEAAFVRQNMLTTIPQSPGPSQSTHSMGQDDDISAVLKKNHASVLKRLQILDETHVFWCAHCKGDLIIL